MCIYPDMLWQHMTTLCFCAGLDGSGTDQFGQYSAGQAATPQSQQSGQDNWDDYAGQLPEQRVGVLQTALVVVHGCCLKLDS